MSRVDEAVELFREGAACSQVVLGVYGPGLGIDRATAMRVAAGFAGGMREGGTCGAVTGAFMVLGLQHGSDDCDRAVGRQAVYQAVIEFSSRFRERNGTLLCRELLGCDVGTPEGAQQAREQDLFRTVCPKMVQDAAEILEEMMEENQATGPTG